MKYLFFLVLLVNIVFFLWEINGGVDLTDGQTELFRTEREKLILLLNEIDSVVTTENISAKIQSMLGNSAIDPKKKTDLTSPRQEQLTEQRLDDLKNTSELVESELIQEEMPAEVPEIELEEKAEKQQRPEKPDSIAADERYEKAETENRVVELYTQKPDKLPEQNNKQVRCYEIGPFADKAVLQQWKNQLEGEINFLETQSREIEEIKDYMVYYPAAETFEKSKENVIWLRELGINDLWLFIEGDKRGAISLGLFQSETIAEKAMERYKENGLDVQIAPRYKKVQRYFAHLEMDGKQKDKLIQLLSEMKKMDLVSCSESRVVKPPLQSVT